jgi:hypothetical protein
VLDQTGEVDETILAVDLAPDMDLNVYQRKRAAGSGRLYSGHQSNHNKGGRGQTELLKSEGLTCS